MHPLNNNSHFLLVPISGNDHSAFCPYEVGSIVGDGGGGSGDIIIDAMVVVEMVAVVVVMMLGMWRGIGNGAGGCSVVDNGGGGGGNVTLSMEPPSFIPNAFEV